MKNQITILAAVAVLAAAGITSFGQTPTPMLHYYWDAPTEGTAVDHYIGQLMVNGNISDWPEPIPTNELFVPYIYGSEITIRVAAVDSLNRESGFTLWAELWIDDGPPGVPGDISRTLVLR